MGGEAALEHVAASSSSQGGIAQSDPDALRALREAMESIGDADRQVVELRHQAGLSFAQIAEVLDEPIGTLLARHHRALRKLKSILEAGGMTAMGTPTASQLPHTGPIPNAGQIPQIKSARSGVTP
jgi:DNA-directed RNA polymerase specialized sigma24 family protein